jgi:hypothetical protein
MRDLGFSTSRIKEVFLKVWPVRDGLLLLPYAFQLKCLEVYAEIFLVLMLMRRGMKFL